MAELKSEFLFTLTADLGSSREVGETPRGGTRRFWTITGGTFEGPRLRGEILPDGGDWALYRADGTLEIDVRLIEVRAPPKAPPFCRSRGSSAPLSPARAGSGCRALRRGQRQG